MQADNVYKFNNPSTSSYLISSSAYNMNLPKPSNWQVHLFGGSKGNGITYFPTEGNVPNAFVRWMMKVCLGCRWERIKK